MGAVLLRVVQGNALLQVATGRDKLAKMEQGLSQGTVASHYACPAPVPGVKLICFHPSPPTTQGEAEFAGRLASRYHWHSVVVVTIAPQDFRARLRLERCFSGQVYVMTSSLPLRSWPYQIAYEWGATIKALTVQRSC